MTFTRNRPDADRDLELLIQEVEEETRKRRRRQLIRAVVLISVVALIAGLLAIVFGGGSHEPSSTPAPTVPSVAFDGSNPSSSNLGVLPVGVGLLDGTSCSSPTSCVLVGSGWSGTVDSNVAFRTSDAGGTWTSSAVPASGYGIADVTCSASTCIAGGGNQPKTGHLLVDRSTDGGATWTASTPPLGSRGEVHATACATANACILTTEYGLFWSSNAGATWHAAVSASPGVTTLACVARSSLCIAGGLAPDSNRGTAPRLLMRSEDAGRTWSVVDRLPRDVVALVDATCPSSRSCDVVASLGALDRDELLTTSDGGASWSSHLMPKPIAFGGGLLCASSAVCMGWSNGNSLAHTGTVVALTKDGGVNWSSVTGLSDISILSATCNTGSTCELVGSDAVGVVVLGSSNGGESWRQQTLPAGVLGITGMSCSSVTDCVIAAHSDRGGSAYSTPNGGFGWREDSVPAGTSDLTGISCPTATFCAAPADGILTSTDAGAVWTLTRYPLGTNQLEGVSCETSSWCVLVGGRSRSLISEQGSDQADSVVLVWRNGRLRRASLPAGITSQLVAVSCASGGTCVAVGGVSGEFGPTFPGFAVVMWSRNGGLTWSRATIPASTIALTSVSCPTSKVCVAAGQQLGRHTSEPLVIASYDGGAKWAVVSTVQRSGVLSQVACAGATRCVAIGTYEPFAVELVAPKGGAFTSSILMHAYKLVGVIRSGTLFGVPAASSPLQPKVVVIPVR